MIHRVAGDLGPAITVEWPGAIITGWTITARFKKPNGAEYTRTAVIDESGDGASTAAAFHFDFQSGDLTEGDQSFDLHFDAPDVDAFSLPFPQSLIMRVRHA
jgi:hypothetical protein